MTLDAFRLYHSTIIEHYQYIEHHLEGIYAMICGKPFHAGLEDVEKSSLHQLICEIKRAETKLASPILSSSDYETLEQIRVRRNYWCHECYVEMVFDSKTNAPREKYVRLLLEDLRAAESFRDLLFEKKIPLMHQKPPAS